MKTAMALVTILAGGFGCGGSHGRLRADTPVLAYQKPDISEITGIDEDDATEEKEAPAPAQKPAEAAKPAEKPAETKPAPAATPAAKPATPPAKAPAPAPAPAAKPAK